MVSQSLKMAGVATLGAGVGLVIGYKIAEKRLGARFEERLETETAGMKEFYTNVKQKYDSPEEAAAALIPESEENPDDPRVKKMRTQYNKIVKGEEYDGLSEFEERQEDEPPAADAKVVSRNVFDDQNIDGPYIITQDEFMANETGYEQATLTYYEKGDTVADTRDDIIDNVDAVLGKTFATAFGEGSSDPNTVHVRNEKLQMEFEVVRSERSFDEDVLGISSDEAPHRRVRREG